MMFDSILDPNRLKTSVVKAPAAVSESQRDGQDMANEINAAIRKEKSSLAVAECVPVRAASLERLKKFLETEPKMVFDRLNIFRNSLLTF
ncbi:hypothetical protein NOF04DRAFT_5896 [Fusarium oxysporum II5]|nr:hypothetical protein NOF04DRAFT_5896 [Fusarium oxysporum II5]